MIERFWFWRKYVVRRFFREGIWLALVRHAPRQLIYWATMLAFSRAWWEAGDKTPDELRFEDVLGPWEAKRDKREAA